MTQSWSDGRMDDLNAKVDRVDGDVRALRVEMKTEFAAVRGEMREGFERIDKRFDKIDERFDKVDERFQKIDERFERSEVRSDERFEAMMDRLYSMQRLMIQFCGVAIAALLGVIATLVASVI